MLTAQQIVELYKTYETMYDSTWLIEHEDSKLMPFVSERLDMLVQQLSSIRVAHNSFIERSEALLEPEQFFANKLAGNPVGCQCEACELASDLIPFEQGRDYTTGMINIG
jgi:hypothetical protein